MDHIEPKETAACLVEDVKEARDVLDVDSRLQDLARKSPPFYRKRNLTTLYLLMVPGCLVPAVTLGFDGAMMNGLQAISTWNQYFQHPSGALLGVLTAILSLGAICATPFISMVGDRWGRRMGIILGSTIMAIGGIVQGASVHIAMFLVSRFLIGFGLVFANAYAPILIGELSHPKDRQVTTSLYQTSWYAGATLAAWTTFGTFQIPSEWAWRIPSLLQAAPALVQIIGVWFVPESPRWLVAAGRGEEAKAILTKYHAEGEENDELVELEYFEMKHVIEADLAANNMTWRALVSSPGNRRRLLLVLMLGVFSQWSGNGLVSYYLVRVLKTVGIADYKTENTLNGCLMIWSWITAVTSAFLTARIRRRTQFLISTIGMLAVFATQTLCAGLFNTQNDKAAGLAVIAMLFLFYVFYNLAFNALLYSYPVEFLPYPIRAKGFSVLMFVGKASNFVNAMVNPIGLAAIGWKFYFVYVAWLVVEVLSVFFFFVETKGPSLEAIASRFDNL
ncbi:general substrate transporter [Aspergillus lucknowensis]|uniref:General substrate transporter n=1 Tax=Aspergillus lucknowensis TaxID=176173 RepID=A0ABR4M3P0_9EURO